MKISLTNSKLGDKIPSLNLPAGATCRSDAPCRSGCYALKGTWLYPNVKNSLKANLDEFMSNPEDLDTLMDEYSRKYYIESAEPKKEEENS